MKALLFLTFAGLAFIALNPSQEETQYYLRKIQGNWALISVVADGVKMDKEDLKRSVFALKGNKYSSNNPQFTEYGTLKLDASQKPGAIDLKSADGPLKGQTLMGIYEFDGNNLKACFAEAGKNRPSAFASEPKSGFILGMYQR